MKQRFSPAVLADSRSPDSMYARKSTPWDKNKKIRDKTKEFDDERRDRITWDKILTIIWVERRQDNRKGVKKRKVRDWSEERGREGDCGGKVVGGKERGREGDKSRGETAIYLTVVFKGHIIAIIISVNIALLRKYSPHFSCTSTCMGTRLQGGERSICTPWYGTTVDPVKSRAILETTERASVECVRANRRIKIKLTYVRVLDYRTDRDWAHADQE